MGSIIQAHCECGFKSKEILAGGGMLDFKEVLTAPALCTSCYIFTVRNYLNKYNYCSKCKSKITFYNDKKLWKDKNASLDEFKSIFWWSINLFTDEAFVLPMTSFLCPKCREYNMKFYPCGLWD